jgi:hypothetical protein
MNRWGFGMAFGAGALALAWVGLGFVGTSALALAMTALIAAVYGLGAAELVTFRRGTAALATALNAPVPEPAPAALSDWLAAVPAGLRPAVRARIEGERAALPGPALTPYLVGLLVMLGMLGTFLGMVLTFQGAVFALEGSTDLQAVRNALAAPIKGLGLAFGTSVAGVAASAMLGLMSALSRRERLAAVRHLDARVAGDLRGFSLVHQRQETFRALQGQAQALPQVVEQLQALMAQIDQRHDRLASTLTAQQADFHGAASAAYTGLAETVGRALHTSLAGAAHAAGDSLRPVLAQAMTALAEDADRQQRRTADAVQAQLDGAAAQLHSSTRAAAEAWSAAARAQSDHNDRQQAALAQHLDAFSSGFAARADALVTAVAEQARRAQDLQAAAETARLAAWRDAQDTSAAALQQAWQRAGDEALARQQAAGDAWARTAAEVAARTGAQAAQTLDTVATLVERTEALVAARTQADARWAQEHSARIDTSTALWRQALAELRADEAARGDAAVARLDALQAAAAAHLASLGAALEAPLTRLLQTAAEVPQAASGVITELRQETSRLTARDNAALHERAELLERLHTLVQALGASAASHQHAVAALVQAADTTLAEAGTRFAAAVDHQAARAADSSALAAASAVELAALGEAFQAGVSLFGDTGTRLADSLQQVEAAVTRSVARSDEQLAYYVAQAREVIDLSITAQQSLVEDLRLLRARVPDEVPA